MIYIIQKIVYDLYGMEGLTSGLNLGPRLIKTEEIKEIKDS